MAVIDAQATVFEITDDEATPALQVVGGIKSFSGMDGEPWVEIPLMEVSL